MATTHKRCLGNRDQSVWDPYKFRSRPSRGSPASGSHRKQLWHERTHHSEQNRQPSNTLLAEKRKLYHHKSSSTLATTIWNPPALPSLRAAPWYILGKSNPLADDSSRLFYLSDSDFLTHLNSTFQQPLSFCLVQILSKVVSSVISALQKNTCSVESLLADLLPQMHTGRNGQASFVHWTLAPFSKPSKTKYQSYKSSSSEYVLEHHQPEEIQLGLKQLKTTYSQLAKRSWQWGRIQG